ncbi:hypothetical protein M426DRAFT_26979 [Hypoxylon sp. CI-4A]|nr:hypothetical protein M426DRAFT_26979 [Hypoxylon sp. CI-4A]
MSDITQQTALTNPGMTESQRNILMMRESMHQLSIILEGQVSRLEMFAATKDHGEEGKFQHDVHTTLTYWLYDLYQQSQLKYERAIEAAKTAGLLRDSDDSSSSSSSSATLSEGGDDDYDDMQGLPITPITTDYSDSTADDEETAEFTDEESEESSDASSVFDEESGSDESTDVEFVL